MTQDLLYVAARTGFLEYNGTRVRVVKDVTIVREGHAILRGNRILFKPLHVHYDCERSVPSRPTPPPPPPAKTVQAKPASATAVAPEIGKEE